MVLWWYLMYLCKHNIFLDENQPSNLRKSLNHAQKMTIFGGILRFFIFSILDIGGPKFYEFGPIVAETNAAHPGSPKMMLLIQKNEFFLEIFSMQSVQNIMDHPVFIYVGLPFFFLFFKRTMQRLFYYYSLSWWHYFRRF